jgi:hypothetical protein
MQAASNLVLAAVVRHCTAIKTPFVHKLMKFYDKLRQPVGQLAAPWADLATRVGQQTFVRHSLFDKLSPCSLEGEGVHDARAIL